ncbi:hypothetical protein JCM3770_003698 [Rhodotorula araucariae]
MLSTTLLTLAGAALSVSALPSGGGGKGGFGGYGDHGLGDTLISASNFNEKEAEEKVAFKELCYRNLYADVEAFDLRTDKEVAIKDAKGTDVFLFANLKKDIHDQEFYYEEFCYKQVSIKEHNSKVNADSVLVGLGKRSLGNGFDSGFDSGIGGHGGLGGFGGEYGGFDCDSFLDGWGDKDSLLGGGGKGGFGGVGGVGGIGGIGGGFDGGLGYGSGSSFGGYGGDIF